jgi:uncharacterized phage protein gp47/JayE
MATLKIKSMEQIRDDFLRTYRNELIRRGIPNPNVSYGTEIYIKATALAQQVYVAMNNTVIKGDSLMPDTAQDGDLERFASLYGLKLKPAAGSVGQIIFHTTISPSISVLVSAGARLQDSAGLTYQVETTGPYKEGDKIDVIAIDTGFSTNLNVNSILRWVDLPSFSTPTAEASIAFTGGTDDETIESLRGRVLEKLANPPGGGNWSQVAATAEGSTSSVQKAFIYPACNGPATAGVAITSAPTSEYKGRDFAGDTTVLNNFVIPAVIGDYPEFVDFIITNCVNQTVDVSIGLSLPSAKTASIPGSGNGWLDGNPFPKPIISAGTYVTGYCDVTLVTSETIFRVNCDVSAVPATPNTVVNICWLSKRDWILRIGQGTVSGSNPYTVTLLPSSIPFKDTTGAGLNNGDYIFPAAINMETYVSALLDQFGNLGPGQKIDPSVVSGIFPRAFRRPLVEDTWHSDIGPSITKFLQNTGDEVLDVQYLYVQDVGNGPGKCPYPTSVQNGPFILVPNKLAFYPII